MIHFRLKRLALQSVRDKLSKEPIQSLTQLLKKVFQELSLSQESSFSIFKDWMLSELYKDVNIILNNENDLIALPSSLFNGMTFLIKLEEEEIQQGIMIPGSRFCPFIHQSILPSSIKIRTNCTTGYLQTSRSALKLKTIANSIYLYERENMINLFLDHDKGWNHTINITTINIKTFLDKHHITKSDFFEIKVDNYDTGLCTMHYLNQSEALKKFVAISSTAMNIEERISSILKDPSQPHTQEFVLKSALLAIFNDKKNKACYDLTLMLRSAKNFRLEEKDGQQYFALTN